MPHPFPHRYDLDLTWTGDALCELSAGPRKLLGGPPAQFDGTDETRWSPEHLILGALAQCLMATYFALNKRGQIETRSYTSKAEAVLDKTREGLVFTSFKVVVRLSVPAARVEDARRQMDAAKKYCITSNALKTAPSVETVVDAF